MQLLFEQIAFQLPDFISRVLSGDLAADLWVEVLWGGAGGFTGYVETVGQFQHAKRQQAEGFGHWNWAVTLCLLGVIALHTVCGGEVMFTDDDALDSCGGDARRGAVLPAA